MIHFFRTLRSSDLEADWRLRARAHRRRAMADLANARVDCAPREHGLLDIARDRQRRRALAVDRAVDRIGKAIVGVNRPFDLVEAGGDLPDDVAADRKSGG